MDPTPSERKISPVEQITGAMADTKLADSSGSAGRARGLKLPSDGTKYKLDKRGKI